MKIPGNKICWVCHELNNHKRKNCQRCNLDLLRVKVVTSVGTNSKGKVKITVGVQE